MGSLAHTAVASGSIDCSFGKALCQELLKHRFDLMSLIWRMCFKDMFQEERRRWCAGRGFLEPGIFRDKIRNKIVPRDTWYL